MIWFEPLNPPEKNPGNPGYILISGLEIGTTVTLQPFADVYVGTTPFLLFGGSPLGGTYTGTCVTANVFDPACLGAGNTTTITYTVNIGGTDYSATQPITVTGTAPVGQLISTRPAQALFGSGFTNALVPSAIIHWTALGLTNYFYSTIPESTDYTSSAVDINLFAATVGARIDVVIWQIYSDADYDAIIALYNPEFLMVLQEASLVPYAPFAQHVIDYVGIRARCVGDSPSMYRTAGSFNVRWAAISTLTGLIDARFYMNMTDQCTWTVDAADNFVQAQAYFDSLIPADDAKFGVKMPNINNRMVLNWVLEDESVSTFVINTTLGNWCVGMLAYWVLLNTETYSYFCHLGRLLGAGNLPTPQYDSYKRVVTLFTDYTYSIVWNFGFTGVEGLLCFKLDGTCAFLILNRTDTTQTLLAATVPGILTQFTRDTGYAALMATNPTINESGIVETNATIRPNSVTVATFSRTP